MANRNSKQAKRLPDKDVLQFVLFDRRTKMFGGREHFYEKWICHANCTGFVFYSSVRGDRTTAYYVIEGYGIGTINPEDFTERSHGAPIERKEFDNLGEAEEYLVRFKIDHLVPVSEEALADIAQSGRITEATPELVQDLRTRGILP